MEEFAPEWAKEFELLVSQILLAENSDPTKNGFGGASVFSAFGSLLINPKSNKDTATVFMTLIHESSHSRLFLHHLNDPIILKQKNGFVELCNLFSKSEYFDIIIKKQTKKITRIREKAYKGSVQHFIRALYNKDVEAQDYVFGKKGFVVKPYDFITIS